MRYAPDEDGNFNGQSGYGYVSFEKFIDGVTGVNEGTVESRAAGQEGLTHVEEHGSHDSNLGSGSQESR